MALEDSCVLVTAEENINHCGKAMICSNISNHQTNITVVVADSQTFFFWFVKMLQRH
jgi:hypothetical protein